MKVIWVYAGNWEIHFKGSEWTDSEAKLATKTSIAHISKSGPKVGPHWPGHALDDVEEERQRQDGDEEPGEDDAHHPQAEQHQGQVLEQHLRLHGEAHINCCRRRRRRPLLVPQLGNLRREEETKRLRFSSSKLSALPQLFDTEAWGKSNYKKKKKVHMSKCYQETNRWQEATPPGSPWCTPTTEAT